MWDSPVSGRLGPFNWSSLASSLVVSSPSMSLAVPSWGLPAMISSLALLERSANGGGYLSFEERGGPLWTLFFSRSSPHKKNTAGSPILGSGSTTRVHNNWKRCGSWPVPGQPRRLFVAKNDSTKNAEVITITTPLIHHAKREVRPIHKSSTAMTT